MCVCDSESVCTNHKHVTHEKLRLTFINMLHTENWTNIHQHVTNRKLGLKFMKTELGKVNEFNTKTILAI